MTRLPSSSRVNCSNPFWVRLRGAFPDADMEIAIPITAAINKKKFGILRTTAPAPMIEGTLLSL
jgi:hypothetical protein